MGCARRRTRPPTPPPSRLARHRRPPPSRPQPRPRHGRRGPSHRQERPARRAARPRPPLPTPRPPRHPHRRTPATRRKSTRSDPLPEAARTSDQPDTHDGPHPDAAALGGAATRSAHTPRIPAHRDTLLVAPAAPSTRRSSQGIRTRPTEGRILLARIATAETTDDPVGELLHITSPQRNQTPDRLNGTTQPIAPRCTTYPAWPAPDPPEVWTMSANTRAPSDIRGCSPARQGSGTCVTNAFLVRTGPDRAPER